MVKKAGPKRRTGLSAEAAAEQIRIAAGNIQDNEQRNFHDNQRQQ